MFVKKGKDVRQSKKYGEDEEVCAAFAVQRSDAQAISEAKKRCKDENRLLLEEDSSPFALEVTINQYFNNEPDVKSPYVAALKPVLKKGDYMENHRLLKVVGPILPDLEPSSCS